MPEQVFASSRGPSAVAGMPWHTSEMTDEMLLARNTTRAEHTSHHRGTSQQRDCLPAVLSPAEQRFSKRLSDSRELTDAELTDATSRQLGLMLHRSGRRSPASSKSGARSASPPERRRRPLSDDAGPSEPAVGERRTMGELKKVLWLERQRQHQAHELRLTFGLPDTEEPLDDFSCALRPNPNPSSSSNPNPNPNPNLLPQSYNGRRAEKACFTDLASSPSPPTLPSAVTGTAARPIPSLSEPQAKVVQTFSNAVVGQSMWGKRADGAGIVILLATLGRSLRGKDIPIAQYKDPKLGDHSAAPLPAPLPRAASPPATPRVPPCTLLTAGGLRAPALRRFALLLRSLLVGRFGSFPEAAPWLVFQFNYLLKREGVDLRLRAETPSVNKAQEVKFTKFMVLTRRKMHWGNVPYQRSRMQLGGREQQTRWNLPYDVLASKHKHQAAEKEMRNELNVIRTRLKLAASQLGLLSTPLALVS